MSSPELDQILHEYRSGQIAFEQGRYRQSVVHLETARDAVEANSGLGGEVQIWLVTAYEALGERQKAIALCQTLKFHPSLQTRKQSRRLLEILEAPKLYKGSEGLIEIPDLSNLGENADKFPVASSSRETSAKAAPVKSKSPDPDIDLTQVNTKDNQFLWVALIFLGLIITSLLLHKIG
ncbi:hypothetical protein B9S53_11195 [Arthrospira sp. O9.13F]|nr:hypothetical protein B9S53_11195 [Arthrospira sp. O9.13F]